MEPESILSSATISWKKPSEAESDSILDKAMKKDCDEEDSCTFSYTLQVPSLGEGASFGHREAVVNAMVYVHTTLHTVNRRCARRGQRVMAITPRHFLDFIQVCMLAI